MWLKDKVNIIFLEKLSTGWETLFFYENIFYIFEEIEKYK